MGGNAQAALDLGGVVIEVLFSADSSGTPQGTIDNWVDAYDLPNTTVFVKDGQTAAEYGPREWGYVVDLCTMRIVWAEFGTFGGGTTSGETGLATLTNCLQNGC